MCIGYKFCCQYFSSFLATSALSMSRLLLKEKKNSFWWPPTAPPAMGQVTSSSDYIPAPWRQQLATGIHPSEEPVGCHGNDGANPGPPGSVWVSWTLFSSGKGTLSTAPAGLKPWPVEQQHSGMWPSSSFCIQSSWLSSEGTGLRCDGEPDKVGLHF